MARPLAVGLLPEPELELKPIIRGLVGAGAVVSEGLAGRDGNRGGRLGVFVAAADVVSLAEGSFRAVLLVEL